MSLVEFNLIILSCVYIINAYDIRNTKRVFSKDFNHTKISIVGKLIEQPLDHFNEKDNRTWQMHYYERLDSWKAGGPIYLYIGGETGVDGHRLAIEGLMSSLAEETNGAMFLSEHRYYGRSLPFSHITTEHLAYLSSRQALADLAKLLKFIKSAPQYKSSKIVVIGGSYAGNLATWMRLIYSDLVDAAVASSAPVFAKKDFYEYLETVGSDFKEYGTPGCYNQIEEIFKRYDELLQTSAGINQLKKEENICEETDMTKQRVDRGVKNTNDMYGGLKPNVTKVVFVNGDMDPWHRLGILEDLLDDAPAILIHGTSHCADLRAESCDDSEELKEARKYIKNLIKKWIGK